MGKGGKLAQADTGEPLTYLFQVDQVQHALVCQSVVLHAFMRECYFVFDDQDYLRARLLSQRFAKKPPQLCLNSRFPRILNCPCQEKRYLC